PAGFFMVRHVFRWMLWPVRDFPGKSSLTYWEKEKTQEKTEEVHLRLIPQVDGGSPLPSKRGSGRKKVNKGTRGMP
ncbi:hypothetical protein, partial [Sphingobacterium haloxyli]